MTIVLASTMMTIVATKNYFFKSFYFFIKTIVNDVASVIVIIVARVVVIIVTRVVVIIF